MNTTKVKTSWGSSHDLYWESKTDKRKRSTVIKIKSLHIHVQKWFYNPHSILAGISWVICLNLSVPQAYEKWDF